MLDQNLGDDFRILLSHPRPDQFPWVGCQPITSVGSTGVASKSDALVKQFTVLAFIDGGQTLHRIYSSHPQQYPVGGRKNVVADVAADWVTRCRDEQAPYFDATRKDVRRIFTDSALIESLAAVRSSICRLCVTA